MIEKITDVKLNLRPVFIGLVHQYYYEGPCRFGKGEELEKDYDVFMNSELYRQFQKDVAENMPLDAVNMMDPIYVERDDWFLTDEEMFRTMAKDIDQVDYYLFSFGIGRGDIYLEFAQRYHKPQGVMPAQCCEATVNTSADRARGLEAYAYRNWEELGRHMRVLRARKALASTRVMVVTRFNSSRSFSSSDNLVDLNYVTEKFGVQFRYQNFHELMDMLTVRDPKTNPTLPGRDACNLTEEDMKEIAHLSERVARRYYEIPKEERHGKCQITASSSFFIPKPFTPFQWAPMLNHEDYIERAAIVKHAFLNQLNKKSLRYNWHDAEVSVLEGVFARGDRKIASVIEEAYRMGCIYDSWSEQFDNDKWMRAFDNTGIEIGFYNLRERGEDEVFPWDFIDIGVTKKFLRREWDRAMKGEVTPNCRMQCSGCGVAKWKGGVCIESKN